MCSLRIINMRGSVKKSAKNPWESAKKSVSCVYRIACKNYDGFGLYRFFKMQVQTVQVIRVADSDEVRILLDFYRVTVKVSSEYRIQDTGYRIPSIKNEPNCNMLERSHFNDASEPMLARIA